MRYMFLAVLVAAVGGFTLASCGNSSKHGDMGADMAGAGGSTDMAVAKLNCLGVGYCIYQCVSGGQGDFQGCYNMCNKQAKPGSAMKWANAFVCGQDYCWPPSDMMGKCVPVDIPPGEPGYVDPGQPGYPAQLLCDAGQTYDQCKNATTGQCISCIENARNIVYADFSVGPPAGPPTGMCPDPTSPDCKGGAMCMTVMNTCLGDM